MKFDFEMESEGKKPGRCCANLSGFSLHANVCIPGKARRQLERIFRYAARPAVATERLFGLPDGKLLYRLKRHWRDGTKAVIYEPMELMERLAALTPPPRFNRFYSSINHGQSGFKPEDYSKKPCEAWNWRQANGALRDMVCRNLILTLHRAGHIELPAVRQMPHNPLARRGAERSHPVPALVDTKQSLQTVTEFPAKLDAPEPEDIWSFAIIMNRVLDRICLENRANFRFSNLIGCLLWRL